MRTCLAFLVTAVPGGFEFSKHIHESIGNHLQIFKIRPAAFIKDEVQ